MNRATMVRLRPPVKADERALPGKPLSPLRLSRRVFAALVVFGFVLLFGERIGRAQGTGVPAELQTQLLAKLASYDRNFAARASDVVQVLVLVKPGSAKSSVSAATIKAAFARIDHIGGRPHQEHVVQYENAAALAGLCRTKKVALVYVTPGFDDEVGAIRTALTGVDVLTVSAVPEYVPRGIVLGFEVISGKSKISINIVQARQQKIDFKADVLKLMKVYR
jgi:hypothetical protein